MMKQAKNRIYLWYDGDAEGAARFYAKTFPDSSVGSVYFAPGDIPSGKTRRWNGATDPFSGPHQSSPLRGE